MKIKLCGCCFIEGSPDFMFHFSISFLKCPTGLSNQQDGADLHIPALFCVESLVVFALTQDHANAGTRLNTQQLKVVSLIPVLLR